MHKLTIALALAATMLVGCATNGYSAFYTSVPGATPEAIARTRAAPANPVPELANITGSFDPDVMAEYQREGYRVIGYSAFSSGYRQSDGNALKQAAKVGADLVVVLNPQYLGSTTSIIPFTTPTATTSYTTSTATAFGTGGSAIAFGSSKTTTYGTSTTYIPMTITRYQYGAFYLVKVSASHVADSSE